MTSFETLVVSVKPQKTPVEKGMTVNPKSVRKFCY